MAATSDSPHLPALGAHVRAEVGHELEAMLLELIDLSLLGKQLHWSVCGPQFPSVHKRLDDLVEAWREMGDTIAERAVAIGYWPDGQAEAVATSPEHMTVARGPVEDEAVGSLLVQTLAEVAERARERLARLGELDLISQDVMTGVVGELEKQLWMTRAELLPGH